MHRILPKIKNPRSVFKENLSTGWDCPRAETMMSFRHAQDATYIAQLLGRMIRTPLQRHIDVDETLNEVRLFLPHFNKDNVEAVMKALQDEEGSDIPADVEGETYGNDLRETWGYRPKKRSEKADPNQTVLAGFDQSKVFRLTLCLTTLKLKQAHPQRVKLYKMQRHLIISLLKMIPILITRL